MVYGYCSLAGFLWQCFRDLNQTQTATLVKFRTRQGYSPYEVKQKFVVCTLLSMYTN